MLSGKMAVTKTRALFVGRFQPFHNGHYSVVKKLLAEYSEVIIAIGSAEELNFENPFTAGERIEMIRNCFTEKELSRLILVPIRDINNDKLWVFHVTKYVPKFDVVFSNNKLVKTLFLKVKIPVKTIGFFDRHKYEGKKIRNLMVEGNKWKVLVPKPVANFISKHCACDSCGTELTAVYYYIGKHLCFLCT